MTNRSTDEAGSSASSSKLSPLSWAPEGCGVTDPPRCQSAKQILHHPPPCSFWSTLQCRRRTLGLSLGVPVDRPAERAGSAASGPHSRPVPAPGLAVHTGAAAGPPPDGDQRVGASSSRASVGVPDGRAPRHRTWAPGMGDTYAPARTTTGE